VIPLGGLAGGDVAAEHEPELPPDPVPELPPEPVPDPPEPDVELPPEPVLELPPEPVAPPEPLFAMMVQPPQSPKTASRVI